MSKHATPRELTERLMDYLNSGDDAIVDEIISDSKLHDSVSCKRVSGLISL
jgi:hypothetical protein